MKTLIIGKGQVGQALYEVVKNYHDTYIKDIEDLDVRDIEVLHICYPDHDDFILTTKNYIEKYKPKVTIINSSVRVGTSASLPVVYSPVRGRHPKLASDLKIYTKFVFSKNEELRGLAATYFEICGMNVYEDSDVTAGETLKLISNVHMGLEIAWRQEVERILTNFGIDPFIYEEWERSYRNGYLASKDDHLIRPSMRPDAIGGHCILPCIDILERDFPSKAFEFIKESDKKIREVA